MTVGANTRGRLSSCVYFGIVSGSKLLRNSCAAAPAHPPRNGSHDAQPRQATSRQLQEMPSGYSC